jgi:hypothetical protein
MNANEKKVKFGKKTVTLTLDRIDPRTGSQLWHGDNGRAYLYYAGRFHLAQLTIG